MDRQMQFQIIVRQLEDGEILGESLIKEIEVKKPKNIMDVGFRHSEQISIILKTTQKFIQQLQIWKSYFLLCLQRVCILRRIDPLYTSIAEP